MSTKERTVSKKKPSEEAEGDSTKLLQRSIALPGWMWEAIDNYITNNKKKLWRPHVRSRNRFLEELALDEFKRVKATEADTRNVEMAARRGWRGPRPGGWRR